MTPEEKLEHLFDEFVWAWYRTCLPTDRQNKTRMQVPIPIDELLVSRRIAELILTRYDEAFERKRRDMRSLALRYRRSRKYASTDHSDIHGRATMFSEDVRQMKEDFFQFQLRSLLLPDTVEEMQAQLQVQAPWMLATFTASERELLADIAAWHAQQ